MDAATLATREMRFAERRIAARLVALRTPAQPIPPTGQELPPCAAN